MNKNLKLIIKPFCITIAKHIIAAVFLAIFIMIFIGQGYNVNGPSMEDTLYSREKIFVEKISYRFTEPKRGDIIVLRSKEGPFIKRIIAKGGDIIEERKGTLFLNDLPMDEPYVTYCTDCCWGPEEVPRNHYWVMGDNRRNSKDSRTCVGLVAREDIIGRAILRFWPLGRIGSLR